MHVHMVVYAAGVTGDTVGAVGRLPDPGSQDADLSWRHALPTYSYVCTGCGQVLDVRQAMADAPLTSCPNCQARLRKLVTAPLLMTAARSTGSGAPRSGGGCSPGGGCCG